MRLEDQHLRGFLSLLYKCAYIIVENVIIKMTQISGQTMARCGPYLLSRHTHYLKNVCNKIEQFHSKPEPNNIVLSLQCMKQLYANIPPHLACYWLGMTSSLYPSLGMTSSPHPILHVGDDIIPISLAWTWFVMTSH